MTSGETAAVCCPSGYACPQSPSGACTSYAFGPTTIPLWSCSGDITVATYITLPHEVSSVTVNSADVTSAIPTTTIVSSWLLSAGGVQLRWKDSDLPQSTASPSPTPTPNPSTSIVPAASGHSQQHSGITTAEKVTLGVVPSAVALICIGFKCIQCRRRKRLHLKNRQPITALEDFTMVVATQDKVEMDAQRTPHELGPSESISLERHELDISK
ncbi:hypothetical protein K431DRAFT_343819 [Polychaeton citri CBS 116435]|uniref:Uncharacterized protein n=1 Tax=Polychaeton citri CBS 116435 TaxID=1314669 RepID=A0A9P4QC20_9PEZI|nr:hypothetical protein K431DRAFT_343819 [Polychaeton citri CBS 116435]